LTVGNLLRSSYLLYFSKPAADRALYQALRRQPIGSIVELGISLAGRTQRLLEVATWQKPNGPVRYTGIDLFEARPPGGPPLSVKQAFAGLRSPHVHLQLVPGDPESALRRMANSLAGTDLLLIAVDQDRDTLARAWNWIPRMLTAKSLVFLEEPTAHAGQTQWRPVPHAEIQRLAQEAAKTVRRAA
jgi:hypothetical protein